MRVKTNVDLTLDSKGKKALAGSEADISQEAFDILSKQTIEIEGKKVPKVELTKGA